MAQAATAQLAPQEEGGAAPESERVASVVRVYRGVVMREDGGREKGDIPCGYLNG